MSTKVTRRVGRSGVFIRGGSSRNVIGGTGNGGGNVIAFCTLGHGVFISDDAGSTVANTVRGNSIHGNALLRIDLAPGDPAQHASRPMTRATATRIDD